MAPAAKGMPGNDANDIWCHLSREEDQPKVASMGEKPATAASLKELQLQSWSSQVTVGQKRFRPLQTYMLPARSVDDPQ